MLTLPKLATSLQHLLFVDDRRISPPLIGAGASLR